MAVGAAEALSTPALGPTIPPGWPPLKGFHLKTSALTSDGTLSTKAHFLLNLPLRKWAEHFCIEGGGRAGGFNSSWLLPALLLTFFSFSTQMVVVVLLRSVSNSL